MFVRMTVIAAEVMVPVVAVVIVLVVVSVFVAVVGVVVVLLEDLLVPEQECWIHRGFRFDQPWTRWE